MRKGVSLVTLQSDVGWSCSHLKVWDKGVYFQGGPLMWLASWCLSMGLHGCSHDMAADFPHSKCYKRQGRSCRPCTACLWKLHTSVLRIVGLRGQLRLSAQSPREEVSSRTRIAWATGGFLQGRGVFELCLKV